jgi:rhodanese-related sulfurtransferase
MFEDRGTAPSAADAETVRETDAAMKPASHAKASGPVAARGAEGYAGDLSPRAAWDKLAHDERAVLVDCRSAPEWSFVGVPDLSGLGRAPVLVSWQHWSPGGAMAANPGFLGELAAAGVAKDAPVVFICRSGARSRAAAIAATRAGYREAYNLAGGFEGARDAERHRGRAEGWKAAGLPWTQD